MKIEKVWRNVVYAILFDGHAYVGVTGNIYTRIGDHLYALKQKRHSCPKMQEMWDRNVEFSVEVLGAYPDSVYSAKERLRFESKWAQELSIKYQIVSSHEFSNNFSFKKKYGWKSKK